MSENKEDDGNKEIKRLFKIFYRILTLIEKHMDKDLYDAHKKEGMYYIQDNEIQNLRAELNSLEGDLIDLIKDDFMKQLRAL